MRDKIFISHATPEDNSFAIWLASRLSGLGYDTWLDKNALVGGEKFWEEIDQVIRNQAAQFLLVYSKSICINNEPGRLRDGVYKEFSLAESISKQMHLTDFITLLNTDGSAYNLFIGADRLNQISFDQNWAEGLKQLSKKLINKQIPQPTINQTTELTSWYENEYVIKSGIIEKRELYYTNLWPVVQLPDYFYMFQFESEPIARNVYEREFAYPISKVSNILSSFSSQIPLETELQADTQENHTLFTPIRYKERFEIQIQDIFNGYTNSTFPTHTDATNHFKSLLRRIFHLFMKRRKMFWYKLANRSQAYYYTPANLIGGKVRFKYPFREHKNNKSKALIGKYLSLGKWHYAISCRPVVTPFLAFSLKAHLVFTNNGFTAWDDKDKMHRHRRTKGRYWFNEEWRDLLLAFLNGLKDENGKIEIPLNESFILSMNPVPMVYWSDFGYLEPAKKNRHNILTQDDDSDDE